jgi:multiple sugar transport system ATP-binding protein
MTMADKIVVLNAGEIEQVGSPLELYNSPGNLFVAGFIGSPKMNFVPATCKAAGPEGITAELQGMGTITLPRPGAASLAGEALTIGIRPEHLALGNGAFDIEVTPNIVERLGIHTVVY